MERGGEVVEGGVNLGEERGKRERELEGRTWVPPLGFLCVSKLTTLQCNTWNEHVAVNYCSKVYEYKYVWIDVSLFVDHFKAVKNYLYSTLYLSFIAFTRVP